MPAWPARNALITDRARRPRHRRRAAVVCAAGFPSGIPDGAGRAVLGHPLPCAGFHAGTLPVPGPGGSTQRRGFPML